MTLAFTWRGAKATSNQRKHHVSFETAARVFSHPFALSEHDRIEDGEHRWQIIGSVEGAMVLLVAYTVHDAADGTEIIHIISARRAERAERRSYEKEKYRHPRT
jgi:uncharacterized DUF497 family protein